MRESFEDTHSRSAPIWWAMGELFAHSPTDRLKRRRRRIEEEEESKKKKKTKKKKEEEEEEVFRSHFSPIKRETFEDTHSSPKVRKCYAR